MWEILSKGSMGLVLLLDNTRQSAERLEILFRCVSGAPENSAIAVGVTKMDIRFLPGVDVYQKYLAQHNF